MKTKLFLLLTVLSVLSTQAQHLTIKGRVTDTSQEAIIAANVSLWTTDSTLVTGVTSDTQGKFALNKIKAGNYRLAITFIGYQSEVILLKLNNNLDLGDVQLQEDAVSLGEVTVSASNVLQRVDRQIILPTESQLKRSFGAYDLLNNLGIARLQVDKFTNSMSISGGGAVQTRINGIKVTDKEIAAVRAKDVLRVEFIEDPGKQYGDDELGAVVNIILRRRETGGCGELPAFRLAPYPVGREFPECEVQLQELRMGHRLLQQEWQIPQPPRISRNVLSGRPYHRPHQGRHRR